jgi:hypothetical protein
MIDKKNLSALHSKGILATPFGKEESPMNFPVALEPAENIEQTKSRKIVGRHFDKKIVGLLENGVYGGLVNVRQQIDDRSQLFQNRFERVRRGRVPGKNQDDP